MAQAGWSVKAAHHPMLVLVWAVPAAVGICGAAVAAAPAPAREAAAAVCPAAALVRAAALVLAAVHARAVGRAVAGRRLGASWVKYFAAIVPNQQQIKAMPFLCLWAAPMISAKIAGTCCWAHFDWLRLTKARQTSRWSPATAARAQQCIWLTTAAAGCRNPRKLVKISILRSARLA